MGALILLLLNLGCMVWNVIQPTPLSPYLIPANSFVAGLLFSQIAVVLRERA